MIRVEIGILDILLIEMVLHAKKKHQYEKITFSRGLAFVF
jgi:hypothetical protein